MPGIDPKVATHKLYVDPTFQPIKQKKRLFNEEKNKAIREEKVMPFGLKNVGAMYQRMLNSIFATQIGHNMEIYVDDMLVKSEKNLPFFKNLRRMSQEKFIWDEESDRAFVALIEYLGSPQLLSRPEYGEILQLYLPISAVAVSSVLVREEEGTQRPIYYVSHVLKGVEEKYNVTDKAAFALAVSARKLKAVKAQALADFFIECTARAPFQVLVQPKGEVADPQEFEWSVHPDGVRNDKGTGARVLIIGPQKVTMEYALQKLLDGPLLLCVSADDIPKVLAEVHEGWYGSHIGARSLAIKITREGYYWPTLVKDALSYVQRLDACQHLGNAPQQPTCTLTPVISPIPFAMWRIDLVRKLPKAKGGAEFAIVAVDYFNKWVEMVPLKKTRGDDVTHFLWKSILTRFGIPKILIFDNGPQFEGQVMADSVISLGLNTGILFRVAKVEYVGWTSCPERYGPSAPPQTRPLKRHLLALSIELKHYYLQKWGYLHTDKQEDLDGKPIVRTWHASKLCKYYM
ncbi:hypothetical protein LIER_30887 [Lithospermum erythrorhizon]|uniref:Integrase catalytic domain-containing protein n=1 Tax=Lithospermum erythrorhizon TaxID=34254 RepID=A0AAV3RP59_LITER